MFELVETRKRRNRNPKPTHPKKEKKKRGAPLPLSFLAHPPPIPSATPSFLSLSLSAPVFRILLSVLFLYPYLSYLSSSCLSIELRRPLSQKRKTTGSFLLFNLSGGGRRHINYCLQQKMKVTYQLALYFPPPPKKKKQGTEGKALFLLIFFFFGGRVPLTSPHTHKILGLFFFCFACSFSCFFRSEY